MNKKSLLYIGFFVFGGILSLSAGDHSLGKKATNVLCKSVYLMEDNGELLPLIREGDTTTPLSVRIEQSEMLSDLFDANPRDNTPLGDITVPIPKSNYADLLRLRKAWDLLESPVALQFFLRRNIRPAQLSSLINHAYYCAIPLLIKAIKQTMLRIYLKPEEYAAHHGQEAYNQRWKSLDPLAHQKIVHALLRQYRQHFIRESQYYVKPVAHDLKYTPDSRILATTPGQNIELLDTVGYKTFASLEGHAAWINSIDIKDDGKKLLSGSTDTSAILWDLEAQLAVKRFTEHTAPLYKVCCSSDNKLMASSSEDGIVKIWDHAQVRSIATIYLPGGNNLIAFNPESTRLAISYKPLEAKYSNTIAFYDLGKGEKEEEITSMNGVASLVWDPVTHDIVFGDRCGKV